MTAPIVESSGVEAGATAARDVPNGSSSSLSSSTTASMNATTQFLQNVRTNIKTLPAALAVIASLTSLLETQSPTTLAETLDLLSVLSKSLKNEYSNGGAEPLLAVPVSAGLEIFQRWLLSAGATSSSLSSFNSSTVVTPLALSRSNTGLLSQYETHSSALDLAHSLEGKGGRDGEVGAGEGSDRFDADFEKNRSSFLARTAAFVEEGVQSKKKIAESARRIIKDGSLVLIPAYDEVVDEVLMHAAQQGDGLSSTSFNVAIVADASVSPGNIDQTLPPQGQRQHALDLAHRLRELEVPTTIVPPKGIAHFLTSRHQQHQFSSGIDGGRGLPRNIIVISGASALLSNGAILAHLGTQQACIVARALIPPERLDIWIVAEKWKSVRWFPALRLPTQTTARTNSFASSEAALDITAPDLITAFLTERGTFTPAALAEESIKAWF